MLSVTQVSSNTKSTHTDEYLLFVSHHPLIHKIGAIRTLFHRADNIPSSEEAKLEDQSHLNSSVVIKNLDLKKKKKKKKNSNQI